MVGPGAVPRLSELSFFALEARPYGFALLLWHSPPRPAGTGPANHLGRRHGMESQRRLLVHFQPVVALSLCAQVLWMGWRLDWRARRCAGLSPGVACFSEPR
jgi:hypothetical protein